MIFFSFLLLYSLKFFIYIAVVHVSIKIIVITLFIVLLRISFFFILNNSPLVLISCKYIISVSAYAIYDYNIYKPIRVSNAQRMTTIGIE